MPPAVFSREDWLAVEWRPGDRNIRIVPYQGLLKLGLPEVGHFVGDIRGFRKRKKTVGQASGNPDHFPVRTGEPLADPFAESARFPAQIDGHVEDFALQHANQFSLSLLALVVQSPQNASVRM